MIAVTCRNGEHFTVDPSTIERIETVPDTVIHLVGGRTYVLTVGLDELLRTIRDSYAERLVVQKRLAGGTADPAHPASTVRPAGLRVERRTRSRDGDDPGSPADRRPAGTPPEV